ncbi:MAG: hypothetical protein ACR2Q3_16700 [Woeseiaceae bacterium]
MSILSVRRTMVAAASILVLLVACGDSDEAGSSGSVSGDSILTFIPADTPYVFATTGDAPDDVIDKLTPQLDATLSAYHQIIRAVAENAYAKARENDENVDKFEQALPFIDELESLMSTEGFADAGIDRDSQYAFYGAGLLPVMRISLSDSQLMEAAIKRLEEKAEQEMLTSTIDGNSYRYAGDDEGRVVVAIIEDNLVVTLVPSSLPEDQLKQVLGLTLPTNSMAASGMLTDIRNEYGYDDYMVGSIDFERIVATFIDPQTGVNAELLKLMEYDETTLDEVCVAEIRTMSGVMPRAVMGYSELSVDRITSHAVMELRDDIATAVSALTAPVAGLGESHGGLFSFGMSMDLLALREFYSDRLDALEANPLACEFFADLQAGVESGREVLNQPIPPIVYGFKGFLAAVDSIEGMNLSAQQPPTSVDMKLLVAIENAEGLLAMGAMFSPELASLNLASDGEPVRVNLPMADALAQIIYMAMTDEALAISVGEGMQDGLGDLLEADVADQPPFLYAEMDAAAYYEFVGNSMAADIGSLGEMPEVREAVEAMNAASQLLMDRVSIGINFTGNGIEVDSDMTLKD